MKPPEEDSDETVIAIDTTTTIAPVTTTPFRTTSTGPPQPCEGSLDALAHIRNELFVFKRRFFWRFDTAGYLVDQPMEIVRFWHGFPDGLPGVDAVYERRVGYRDEIVFFSGKQNIPCDAY